jgi:lysophospholipase L1-like esterase
MKNLITMAMLITWASVWMAGDDACGGETRLGNIKAEKILFLGNSITAVPQRNATVWWGLSASTPAKDYAHLLAASIDAKTGGKLAMLPTTAPTTKPDGSVEQCDSNVINIADVFERGYASYDASKISKQLTWKADIVILQFGENIPAETFKADVFRQNLKKLLADIKASSHPHIFVAGYILGANPTIDDIKRQLCEEDPTHRVFVDLSSVGKDAANMGEYGHPNDKGMALIADAIFKAIVDHSAASTTSEDAHDKR